MPERMAPRRKDESDVHPDYLKALRRSVEDTGVERVASEANMSRTTLWLLLKSGKTLGAALRVHAALTRLGVELPPPIILTRGPGDSTWDLARRRSR